MHKVAMSILAVFLVASAAGSGASGPVVARALDGSGNNVRRPDWGKAGTQYLRVGRPNYTDRAGKMVTGPSPRYISNRVFNDVGQNLFSENGISQWGWAWGQFVDHDIGLRDETPGENASMAFDSKDPLEGFQNDFGALAFTRTPAAPGTGTQTARQQINTIDSFIDASNVYGVTNSRLDWLRAGRAGDGNPANNRASLLLSGDDYLPRVDARATVTAPPMDLMGRLVGTPEKAVVAGDVRANENVALTSIHTLFAREHNRIVEALRRSGLTTEARFEVARRVVGAEVQYITYNEFLPTLGVELAPYRGYDPSVNPSLGNEFATVGYRAHSMIHGEFDVTVPEGTYTEDQLTRVYPQEGIGVEREAGAVKLEIPLVAAFGNPDLLESVGEGPILESLGAPQYKNDEQIDNTLRSVLFQVPKPDAPDPASCGTPVVSPNCFAGVADLGADDIQRGRDHGMPSYNDMRRAFGLPRVRSFTDLTGEATDRFPSDRTIRRRDPINDPNILDFTSLQDAAGEEIPIPADEDTIAVSGTRRTTLAARLRAVYGSVDNVDAFVGMVSEPHVEGTEFGPLQLAIWKRQFQALRDGDRYFYANDPLLRVIERAWGITYRHTLAELVELDAGTTVAENVFKAVEPEEEEATPTP